MAYENKTGLPSVTQVIAPWLDTTWYTEESRDRGSAVHAAASAHAKGAYVIPLREEWQGYVDSFRTWFDQYVDELVVAEIRFVDKQFGFCGKPDMIVRMKGDQGLTLLDLKTAAAFMKAWRLQIAAYRHLADKHGYKTFKGMSLRLKKDGSGCLANYCPVDYRRDLNRFFGGLNMYRFLQ